MGYNLKPTYSSVDELQSKDRAISILYGRLPDNLGGSIVPIRVDGSGNLIIGTALSLDTDDLDIGDVVVKGITDPTLDGSTLTVGEERFGLHRVGDLTAVNADLHAVLSWDPRMNFSGASLNITTSGSGVVFATATATIDSPAYDSYTDVGSAYSVQGYSRKSFTLRNTGVNPVNVRGFASVDGGVTYDVPITPAANLDPGGLLWVDEERAFTHFKFQVQRNAAGDSSVELKGFAQ